MIDIRSVGISVHSSLNRALARAILIALGALSCGLLATASRSVLAEPASVETFFRKPQFGDAQLSPNGRYLAVLAPVGEHIGLGIIDLVTHASPVTMSAAGEGDVVGIFWQNDDRLLAVLGDREAVAGEPPRQRGVVAINRDGTQHRILAKSFERPWSVSLLRTIPDSNEVFLTALDRSIYSLDVYRYNTLTGAKTLLSFDPPGHVSRWLLDFDGVPRAAVTDDLSQDASAWYVRKSSTEPWIKVEGAKLARLKSHPLQFDPSGQVLYVSARRDGADLDSIYEYNIASATWGKQIISHPQRDVDQNNARFLVDYRARKLLGLAYTEDRPSVVWFDAERARIQKSIDTALPDTRNVLYGSSNAKRWIVVAQSDRNPGDAYLLDSTTMRMEQLLSYEPWIDPNSMASTKWVRYNARDGLSIPALLTTPSGAQGRRVPLVVDIHGGPYVEATSWHFDPEVQFFASRGYAVLQPQFRGTAGFGWKHVSSGYRRWGDEMQDDLEDGVKWLVAQGIADASRVCFYGASYGGYAALWGAIKNANSIKCAVGYVAVTSIEYLFDNPQTDLSQLADKSSLMSIQIGDPTKERSRFKRVSPLDNAEKVAVPVMLAYGGSDLRVPLVHGTDFRAALDKYHKEYEWVEYAVEGHGFNRDENRFDYYRRVDRFLAKYLQDGAAADAASKP